MANKRHVAAVAWCLCVLASHAYCAVGDVMIDPTPVTSGTRVIITETVRVCFHRDPQKDVYSDVVTTGSTLTVTVHSQAGGVCFSAGDPPVEKPMVTALPPMPAGAYSVHYIHVDSAGHTLADKVLALTVVQALCEYDLAYGPLAVTAPGEELTFYVQLKLGSLSNCQPSFVTNVPWLHAGRTSIVDVPPNDSVYHGYAVTVSADANPGMERRATFVLAEHVFTLYQNEASTLPDGRTRVKEYYNAKWDHYFMTANRLEQDALGLPPFEGWQPTGQYFAAWGVARSNPGVPVCRFFNDRFVPKSTHFYGIEATCDQVTRLFPDWQKETDAAFQIMPPPPDNAECSGDAYVPVFRLYNNGKGGAPNHRYVTGLDLRAQMIGEGWTAEGSGPLGIAFCAPQFY